MIRFELWRDDKHLQMKLRSASSRHLSPSVFTLEKSYCEPIATGGSGGFGSFKSIRHRFSRSVKSIRFRINENRTRWLQFAHLPLLQPEILDSDEERPKWKTEKKEIICVTVAWALERFRSIHQILCTNGGSVGRARAHFTRFIRHIVLEANKHVFIHDFSLCHGETI